MLLCQGLIKFATTMNEVVEGKKKKKMMITSEIITQNERKCSVLWRLLHTDVLKTKYSHTFTLAAAILETHKNKIAVSKK